MSTALTPTPPAAIRLKDPMELIQQAFDAAIAQGGALEVVDRILEQQKWMIRHNEEQRFNESLKRIQRQLKKIPKRGYNKETHSNYALAEDVDDGVQHLLDEEGMTLTFVPKVSDKPDMVLIVGCLALDSGAYSREYPLEMPADGKGPKGGGVMSRTHATGSAITYGKRYLKNMIFDLRFKEKDDDGNAAKGEPGEMMDEHMFDEFKSAMEGSGDLDELKKNYFAARDKATALRDTKAMESFANLKNECIKRLNKKAGKQ